MKALLKYNNTNIFSYTLLLLTSLFLFSCQKVEIIENVVFDYKQFKTITFLSSEIEVIDDYKPRYENPYLDHLIGISPSNRLIDWLKNNIKGLGAENKLLIIVKDASIISSEVDNEEKIAGILKKPKEYKYELNYQINFNILDDNDIIIAETKIKVDRSTTSSKSISLAERDKILDDLIYNGLIDLVDKTEISTKKYLNQYIL